MSDSKNKDALRRSVIDFVTSEIEENKSDEDFVESLEIVKQCLENSYSKFNLPSKAPCLLKTFSNGLNPNVGKEISSADKETAEQLKNQGNQCMKEENFKDAVNCYTEALKIDPNNPVFLCNRAAAFSKMSKYIDSIVDCKLALKIDPNYSKAYGRMGLAYSSLGDNPRSIECYKKSLELDPNNESAKQNLAYAESRQQSNHSSNPSVAGLADALPGGLDIGQMQRIAGQLMNDPNMTNMFSNLLSNFTNQNINSNERSSDSNNQQNSNSGTGGLSINPETVNQFLNAFTNPQNSTGTNTTNPPETDNSTNTPNLSDIFNDQAFRMGQETLMRNPDLMNSILRNLTQPPPQGNNNSEGDHCE